MSRSDSEHKTRLQAHRAHLAERQATWPHEPRGNCTRCGRSLTNATIKHLAIQEPYLGPRGAVFVRGGSVGIDLCPACVQTVIQFASKEQP
jgi:hypothetical protein